MPTALSVVIDALPYLLQGSLLTASIVVAAMLLGLVIGTFMAVGLVYGNKVVRYLLTLYLWIFRGVPVVVLLFLFYFGIFNFFGLPFSAFTAVTIVLGMTTGAYQANIFRGAILSLPQGQFKAASGLGMTDSQAIRCIILPQILRISIPAWSNEFSIILKDSALAFVIGAPEIMARTQFVASRTYQHLAMYITAGVIYFFLTWAGVMALRKLEQHVRIPGYSYNGSR
ncbi:amino acid ABC transporter permease [Desulfosarcina ovata]|uniref:Amino acid ABC transporter permease n=2 Tax=Desulfosarcina ovata TaxID=83564 RepID=A0A5K8ACP4_9BACT|nr:amino acid ABC transporter permease [Desulfosarcina ovata]BBO83954.1 amino acid ABC transporter permease [Desulfosarcina ovata subsp. sediminis]BBO90432.1 amino acid ABC transporter permease [Desulfosarcina ovata subsp. ovata]